MPRARALLPFWARRIFSGTRLRTSLHTLYRLHVSTRSSHFISIIDSTAHFICFRITRLEYLHVTTVRAVLSRSEETLGGGMDAGYLPKRRATFSSRLRRAREYQQLCLITSARREQNNSSSYLSRVSSRGSHVVRLRNGIACGAHQHIAIGSITKAARAKTIGVAVVTHET